jgi:hypothetical protein
MTHLPDKQNIISEITRVITELQNGSGYGSVEIILHDGNVTLIEKREKLRFTKEISKSTAFSTLNAHRTVTTE